MRYELEVGTGAQILDRSKFLTQAESRKLMDICVYMSAGSQRASYPLEGLLKRERSIINPGYPFPGYVCTVRPVISKSVLNSCFLLLLSEPRSKRLIISVQSRERGCPFL